MPATLPHPPRAGKWTWPLRRKNLAGDASLHQQPRQMLRIRLRLSSSLRRCMRASASWALRDWAVDESAWLLAPRGDLATMGVARLAPEAPPAPPEPGAPGGAIGGVRLLRGATFGAPGEPAAPVPLVADDDDEDGEPVPVPVWAAAIPLNKIPIKATSATRRMVFPSRACSQRRGATEVAASPAAFQAEPSRSYAPHFRRRQSKAGARSANAVFG